MSPAWVQNTFLVVRWFAGHCDGNHAWPRPWHLPWSWPGSWRKGSRKELNKLFIRLVISKYSASGTDVNSVDYEPPCRHSNWHYSKKEVCLMIPFSTDITTSISQPIVFHYSLFSIIVFFFKLSSFIPFEIKLQARQAKRRALNKILFYLSMSK